MSAPHSTIHLPSTPKNIPNPLAGDDSDELLIAIMGPTGSGKSSFINVVSGSGGAVGHTLKSCTREVEPTPVFQMGGHRVRLIDTPGFDDSKVSDADILQKIADFMDVSYRKGRKLNGLLYFHRIIDNRVGGVSYMNMQMFQKLCGADALRNVFLCTTMWDLVTPEVGEEREKELKDDFWASMIEQGASVVRHDGTYKVARDIISRMLHFSPVTLKIQQELVDEEKTLMETMAGARISEALRSLESKYRGLLKRAADDYQQAIEEKNRIMQGMIEKQKRDYEEKLEKTKRDNEILLRKRDQTITSLATRLDALEARGRAYWWLFFSQPPSQPLDTSPDQGESSSSGRHALQEWPASSLEGRTVRRINPSSLSLRSQEKRLARNDWQCAIM